MSATTKKKHVTKEVLEEFPLPEGDRQIVKVTAAKGNNLHEVVTADGTVFLASMPTKFRKHVWIKRGDFIMVDPIEEGGKVKAEISHILFKEQIKYIQEQGLWPANFTNKPVQQETGMIPQDLLPPSDEEGSEEELADLVKNMNRVQVTLLESESEDSCSEEEEEESDSGERCSEESSEPTIDSPIVNTDAQLSTVR
ncbi:probable RNA-binding protein EIF1AD [Physella acuta]|uniref:probable RNA-binding protein EIF1AD n=1 Tax=Physella acuta TaxID=109671 RepID=UPI0027DC88B6|nr:probable RNA-binding protein EIF1AD [Physella acuta]XP_059148033.1 probable RNA-binding protein EIF1AD [Physella acuta]XP_059148034.1 probable RNA-binding protein EIF1AD [Physella acuta]